MDVHGSSILPPVPQKTHRCIQQSSTICRLGLYAQCSQDIVPREMWRIQAKNGGSFIQGEVSFVIFVLNVLIQKPSTQYCPTTPRVPNEFPMKCYQVPIRRFINHHQLAPVARFLASNQKPSNIFQHLRKPPAMVLMLQQKWRSTELEENFENPVERKTKAKQYRIIYNII